MMCGRIMLMIMAVCMDEEVRRRSCMRSLTVLALLGHDAQRIPARKYGNRQKSQNCSQESEHSLVKTLLASGVKTVVPDLCRKADNRSLRSAGTARPNPINLNA
jgi:hypothetical protein